MNPDNPTLRTEEEWCERYRALREEHEELRADLEHQKIIHAAAVGILKRQFKDVKDERDEYKYLFDGSAKLVMPGEIDTPDAYFMEFKRMRAEIERFKAARDSREAVLTRTCSLLFQYKLWAEKAMAELSKSAWDGPGLKEVKKEYELLNKGEGDGQKGS